MQPIRQQNGGKMNTTTNLRTRKMVQLALFTAIIALLNLTPLGFINTPGLSITLVGIPVIVGAIVLGPVSGAILGAVFGITSFLRCFGIEPFGTQLLAINPAYTFITCMIPRILMGWLTGLIFLGLKRIDKTKVWSYAATSLIGSLLNTVFFLSSVMIFFYQSDYIQAYAASVHASNVFALFFVVASVNGTVEAITCMIVAGAIAKVVHNYVVKNSALY